MRDIVITLTIMCLTLNCFGVERSLVVPDDYPTIQEAINSAQPGDTVTIKPGAYEESLIFKDGVNIKGMDREKVIIRCDVKEGSVLTATSCQQGTISGLTMLQTGVDELREDFRTRFPILQVSASSIKVIDCNIQGGGNNGIAIVGEGSCEISKCSICRNKKSGIFVSGEKATPVLTNNRCSENGVNGIYFKAGAAGIAEGNVCNKNVYNGISLVGNGTKAKVKNNHCDNNKGSGIYFGPGAEGTAEENNCIENTWNGIVVVGGGTRAVLKNNRCLANKSCGIYFGNRASGTAEGNICNENEWHGMSVADDRSTPFLKNNRCCGNKRAGIYFTKYHHAKAAGNISKNNGEINFGEIRFMLMEGRLGELEEIASRLRTEKRRFANGNWQLAEFYHALGEGWSSYKPSKEEWLFGTFKKWVAERPESITPHIAMARAYTEFAWEGRGGGWAREVMEKGWKIFSENLGKAWEVLAEAEKLNVKDPDLYCVWLRAGLGLGKSTEEMDRLFEKGITIERGYYPLYYQRATSLMPRWGGRSGELEAFASRAVQLTEGEEGESLYAIIADSVLKRHDPNVFLGYGLSYERIKQGFLDILERYSDADYYLNSYCLFASIHNDKKTAMELFDKIGNNWNKDAWRKEEYFNKYRSWAYKQ